jgi:hypothetical protein
MTLSGKNFFAVFRRRWLLPAAAALVGFFPAAAHADWAVVDALNLAPFVPMVLDALMAVATGGYDFFVGRGTGIIYVLIWGWLGVSMGLYLRQMWFPKTWLSLFGFKGGGEMWEQNTPDGMQMTINLLKPAMRAIIAAPILLQIKPIYVTDWIVDPFLRFGAIYTESLTSAISLPQGGAKKVECPPDVVERGWLSKDSCDFLVQPVSDLSHANNQIIKRGFDFIGKGLTGLMTLMTHGSEDFLNLVTGILLVAAFVSSNLFMALLIIQGIFNFGMSLILYPFQVLVWVAKSKSDRWFDFLPAFDGIIKALKQLIITMISCAFILTINVAVVRALFQWNSSVFVTAAGGSAASNVPTMTSSAMGFGQHSVLWLSTILTFYLMVRIFELTREQLDKYVGDKGMGDMHKKVTGDAKNTVKIVTGYGKKIIDAFKKKK